MGIMMSNMIIAYHFYFKTEDKSSNKKNKICKNKNKDCDESLSLIESNLDLKDE